MSFQLWSSQSKPGKPGVHSLPDISVLDRTPLFYLTQSLKDEMSVRGEAERRNVTLTAEVASLSVLAAEAANGSLKDAQAGNDKLEAVSCCSWAVHA